MLHMGVRVCGNNERKARKLLEHRPDGSSFK